ncbi:MAG TPA: SDR family NAD(P)-dependent oxidoreductase [archaeon]|nr:SDR family NAD(P)-dependent oxidoreductase [archaeon]
MVDKSIQAGTGNYEKAFQGWLPHTGKIALVTGAGRGIGLAIARILMDEGARVTICDLVPERVEQAVADLSRHGEVSGEVCDVSNSVEVTRLVQETHSHWNGLDLVVNNAGIARSEPFLESSVESWDITMAVNLRSQFLVGQAAARLMVASGRGGAIVNMSSTNGLLGEADLAAYNASKAGSVLLTKTMAIELAKHHIRVNAVCPGFIMTDLALEAGEDPESIGKHSQKVPMGRMGEPVEVAHAVSFLLSERASFITGTELVVDGGQICEE